jgi:hypothetical protein
MSSLLLEQATQTSPQAITDKAHAAKAAKIHTKTTCHMSSAPHQCTTKAPPFVAPTSHQQFTKDNHAREHAREPTTTTLFKIFLHSIANAQILDSNHHCLPLNLKSKNKPKIHVPKRLNNAEHCHQTITRIPCFSQSYIGEMDDNICHIPI